MNLESIVHAVPALLDACSADALEPLSLTNSALRQEVHARLRSVSQRNHQSKDIAALVSAPFMHLTNLHICATLSVSQVSELTKGDWPMLRKLTLYIQLWTSESIQQITAAPWPQLEELEFGTLDATHLKLLVKKDWPLKVLRCKLCHYMSANDLRDAMSTLQQSHWKSLQSIQLNFWTWPKGIHVEAAGLSELKKGHWQQLTKLALGNWSLDKKAASHLVQGRWPQLQSLAICIDSIDAIPFLTQADWPQLTHLHLTQFLARQPDQGANSPGLAMLKHSSWPMLESLRLTGLKMTSGILHAFSQANWTLLELFVSEFAKWDAATIRSLAEINWPALKQLSVRSIGSTGQVLDAASIETLTKARWPVMESIYLATIPSDVVSLHIILRASWPRLKVFKFRSDGFCPTSIKIFIRAAQKQWVGCLVEEGNPQF